MDTDATKKAELFTRWFMKHMEDWTVPLFASGEPDFAVTDEAETFLARLNAEGMYLYILCVCEPGGIYRPLYIGKSLSPYRRWLMGHLPNLRKAVTTSRTTSYTRWVKTLREVSEPVYLMCIHESAIVEPPIPNFPITVGSVEYQLVSLVDDAFPGQLLNSEGVAR